MCRWGCSRGASTYNHRKQHPYASRYLSGRRRDMWLKSAVESCDFSSIGSNEGIIKAMDALRELIACLSWTGFKLVTNVTLIDLGRLFLLTIR